jgi:NTE family protein
MILRRHKHPWALVLSGGGAKGLAHIGVLKVLKEAGFPAPSFIAGTSIGAIVGGLCACGMSPEKMERFVVEEFNITDYLDSFVFKINGPFGRIIQTGQALASLAGKPGVDTGYRVLELLERLTAGKSFNEVEIPFQCNAVDLFSGQETVFSSGSVAKAMRASMSLPVFFEPFIYNGMCLVDGGLLNDVPVALARKEGFKHVLAVDVNSFATMGLDDLRNGPNIIFRSIECAFRARNEKNAEADFKIDVTVDTEFFSFFRKRELIKLGEQAAMENFNALKKFFG